MKKKKIFLKLFFSKLQGTTAEGLKSRMRLRSRGLPTPALAYSRYLGGPTHVCMCVCVCVCVCACVFLHLLRLM